VQNAQFLAILPRTAPQRNLHLLQCLSLGASLVALTLSGGADQWPTQSYQSCGLNAPFINITGSGKTSPGLIFLAPGNSTTKSQRPTIFDNGELVWQEPSGNVSYFLPQVLNAEPVLTYWSGNESKGGWELGRFIS
jgi:hypothetical protein